MLNKEAIKMNFSLMKILKKIILIKQLKIGIKKNGKMAIVAKTIVIGK